MTAPIHSKWVVPWHLFSLLVVLLALIVLMVHLAKNDAPSGSGESSARAGSIELFEVSVDRVDARFELQASARVQLPASMQAGLDSGVPLAFNLELDMLIPRPFWFDRRVARYQWRYTLTYYELTRHYRVRALETNESRNYRSLSAALNGLGRLPAVRFDMPGDMVANDISNSQSADFQQPQTLIGSIRFRLDTAALPLPLQPLIRSGWKLISQEYRWQLI